MRGTPGKDSRTVSSFERPTGLQILALSCPFGIAMVIASETHIARLQTAGSA